MCTYSHDRVDLALFAVDHEVGEHLDNLGDIKLSGSTESEVVGIREPWVAISIVIFGPSFELIQALLLIFTEITKISTWLRDLSLFFAEHFC